jgi:hypothetical protein
MKIKRHAAVREQTMFTRAAVSADAETRRKAEQYVIDQLADSIETQAHLDATLAAIPDPEQRYMVLDALKPLLKFVPKYEMTDLEIYHVAREQMERREFHLKAEAEGAR